MSYEINSASGSPIRCSFAPGKTELLQALNQNRSYQNFQKLVNPYLSEARIQFEFDSSSKPYKIPSIIIFLKNNINPNELVELQDKLDCDDELHPGRGQRILVTDLLRQGVVNGDVYNIIYELCSFENPSTGDGDSYPMRRSPRSSPRDRGFGSEDGERDPLQNNYTLTLLRDTNAHNLAMTNAAFSLCLKMVQGQSANIHSMPPDGTRMFSAQSMTSMEALIRQKEEELATLKRFVQEQQPTVTHVPAPVLILERPPITPTNPAPAPAALLSNEAAENADLRRQVAELTHQVALTTLQSQHALALANLQGQHALALHEIKADRDLYQLANEANKISVKTLANVIKLTQENTEIKAELEAMRNQLSQSQTAHVPPQQKASHRPILQDFPSSGRYGLTAPDLSEDALDEVETRPRKKRKFIEEPRDLPDPLIFSEVQSHFSSQEAEQDQRRTKVSSSPPPSPALRKFSFEEVEPVVRNGRDYHTDVNAVDRQRKEEEEANLLELLLAEDDKDKRKKSPDAPDTQLMESLPRFPSPTILDPYPTETEDELDPIMAGYFDPNKTFDQADFPPVLTDLELPEQTFLANEIERLEMDQFTLITHLEEAQAEIDNQREMYLEYINQLKALDKIIPPSINTENLNALEESICRLEGMIREDSPISDEALTEFVKAKKFSGQLQQDLSLSTQKSSEKIKSSEAKIKTLEKLKESLEETLRTSPKYEPVTLEFYDRETIPEMQSQISTLKPKVDELRTLQTKTQETLRTFKLPNYAEVAAATKQAKEIKKTKAKKLRAKTTEVENEIIKLEEYLNKLKTNQRIGRQKPTQAHLINHENHIKEIKEKIKLLREERESASPSMKESLEKTIKEKTENLEAARKFIERSNKVETVAQASFCPYPTPSDSVKPFIVITPPTESEEEPSSSGIKSEVYEWRRDFNRIGELTEDDLDKFLETLMAAVKNEENILLEQEIADIYSRVEARLAELNSLDSQSQDSPPSTPSSSEKESDFEEYLVPVAETPSSETHVQPEIRVRPENAAGLQKVTVEDVSFYVYADSHLLHPTCLTPDQTAAWTVYRRSPFGKTRGSDTSSKDEIQGLTEMREADPSQREEAQSETPPSLMRKETGESADYFDIKNYPAVERRPSSTSVKSDTDSTESILCDDELFSNSSEDREEFPSTLDPKVTTPDPTYRVSRHLDPPL